MRASELMATIEDYAPKSIGWEKDRIGLQLGDSNQEIHRVMTTLDVRPEVVDEAIERGADFIFAHHPMMFHAAKTLDLSDPQNAMYAKLLNHQIVVYAAHTNLDAAKPGMNDWLAEDLGIVDDIEPLLPNADGVTGIGRIGALAETTTVAEFAKKVRDVFNVKTVRIIARDLQRPIKRVAVLGGDGGDDYLTAQAKGADAFVTADVYYHTGHDILAHDMVVIDPDHHMEANAKSRMVTLVEKWQNKYNWQLEAVFASQTNTDPYTYL
ncbi:dinuclear metal center YbgI/SA1388 family protein [Weissella uvarum]|uniref:Nif3-like dinuclear metal center hexameric protein n=1 Tax=Weissella uvarum TaxID=1479233 RepID=UPI00195F480E|nr:Nif3-like dinuclear metal center hexameric protein [Weissella uvarum]MBM7617050.1 dinuclear metal center YbgI/SA1388 family protein [Weissella uvarum]MCM0595348.1 Nif3-like dinuclear metal center hexameric protein [Weissella uvarum]